MDRHPPNGPAWLSQAGTRPCAPLRSGRARRAARGASAAPVDELCDGPREPVGTGSSRLLRLPRVASLTTRATIASRRWCSPPISACRPPSASPGPAGSRARGPRHPTCGRNRVFLGRSAGYAEGRAALGTRGVMAAVAGAPRDADRDAGPLSPDLATQIHAERPAHPPPCPRAARTRRTAVSTARSMRASSSGSLKTQVRPPDPS